MTTVREHLEAIRDATAYRDADTHLRAVAALEALGESETAWRADGRTYRLVPDDIEVPHA